MCVSKRGVLNTLNFCVKSGRVSKLWRTLLKTSQIKSLA
eukprot:UN21218